MVYPCGKKAVLSNFLPKLVTKQSGKFKSKFVQHLTDWSLPVRAGSRRRSLMPPVSANLYWSILATNSRLADSRTMYIQCLAILVLLNLIWTRRLSLRALTKKTEISKWILEYGKFRKQRQTFYGKSLSMLALFGLFSHFW